MKSLALILGLLVAVQAFPAKGPTPLDVHMPVIEGAPVPIPPKIIGGNPATLGQFPHQAALLISSQFNCGGSLIAANWILTAAHCVPRATSVEVHLGSIPWLGGDRYATADTTQHEYYNSTSMENDIGLIRLPIAVGMTDYLKTVALTTSADASNNFVGVTATVSGWGITQTGNISADLMWVDLPIITNEECAPLVADPFKVVYSTICTSGAGGRGGCRGDSGGPLVIYRAGVGYTQIGIVSFGRTDCAPGYPSAFSRVTSFRDWIQQKTGV